jgi:hypothetical protein
MSTHYIGKSFDSLDYHEGSARYFYALRTDEEGNIYLTKVDQMTGKGDVIQINNPGAGEDDWENFEFGVDFFDGKEQATHERPYPNLKYDQYKFDSKNLFYYINSDGELVVRYNESYIYPTDV